MMIISIVFWEMACKNCWKCLPEFLISGRRNWTPISFLMSHCLPSARNVWSSGWGVSHPLSNALSPKLLFHYVRIVYHIVAVGFLLICWRQHWPVKTHVPAYQIVYKGYKVRVSCMNILNMSFNTTFPWGIHAACGTGPIRFAHLISHPSFGRIQKSHSATRWSIIRHFVYIFCILM